VIQIVALEMPVDMSYESDSDDDAPKTQNAKRSNNKAPSLNDSEAFPETLGGGASVEASAVPNFAGLAASFQGQEIIRAQRAEIVRKPITRLPRVHKIYQDRSVANKPLSNNWTLYVDDGIQGSEKSAECESTSCGTIHTMKEFFPAYNGRNCSHTIMPGSNIRLFKTDQHTSPSVLDTTLEQGGKWSIPVSKTISRDMFEELALYLLDERLGETVVGTVFAIRDEVDLLQIWLAKAPSPDTVGKMTADITSLLGLADDVSPPDFVSHQSAFKKANKVKKYFLVEPSPRGLPFDSQATSLKPRSRIDTSERKAIKKEKKKSSKKGDEGFTEVQHARKPSKDGKSPTGSKDESGGGADASTSNPFGDLDFGEDDHKKSEKDTLVFNKKKIQKPNSRRNSKKEKKSSGADEFDELQPQRGAVIPFPVFMAAGGAIFLLLAMAAYTYTSGATQ
jgi:hypothetical protein